MFLVLLLKSAVVYTQAPPVLEHPSMKQFVVSNHFLMLIFNDSGATVAFNIEYLSSIKDGIFIWYLNLGAFQVVGQTSKYIISVRFLFIK